jgi:hypothetical protein
MSMRGLLTGECYAFHFVLIFCLNSCFEDQTSAGWLALTTQGSLQSSRNT